MWYLFIFYLFILDQILKHPIIQKRIEYFKSFTDESEDVALLQTIRIPKNLLFLSDKLPQPNYEKLKPKNNSFTKKSDLPDINLRNHSNVKSNIHDPTSKKNKKDINNEPILQTEANGNHVNTDNKEQAPKKINKDTKNNTPVEKKEENKEDLIVAKNHLNENKPQLNSGGKQVRDRSLSPKNNVDSTRNYNSQNIENQISEDLNSIHVNKKNINLLNKGAIDLPQLKSSVNSNNKKERKYF